jgi:hypothetical protein
MYVELLMCVLTPDDGLCYLVYIPYLVLTLVSGDRN